MKLDEGVKMIQKLIDAYELEREMYRRCIDTDIEIEKGRAKWDSGLWIRYKVFEDAITVAPRVEVEPVRHGRMVIEPDATVMHCNVCGWAYQYYAGLEEEWNYCPHCGAKMDEVTE